MTKKCSFRLFNIISCTFKQAGDNLVFMENYFVIIHILFRCWVTKYKKINQA